MSDIIIFPKLQGNLMNQIRNAMLEERFESAYDLFNEYEKHFELSEDEHLLKLECLYQLSSFLELREESSILLNQGHSAYDKIVPYFIESLLNLKQFKTVIELIDGLRTEEVNHRLLVTLMPFYDEAQHQLKQRNQANLKFIQTFKDNDIDKQINLILELIEAEDFRFKMSFVQLIEHNQLNAKVVSFMIQYLIMAEYTGEVKINKFNHKLRFDVKSLEPLHINPFMNLVLPKVIDYYETISPDTITVITELIQQHNLIIYPMDVESLFSSDYETVISGYIAYCNALFNLNDNKVLVDEIKSVLETIQLIENENR